MMATLVSPISSRPRRAATHRRQKRHFVAIAQRPGAPDDFLVHGGKQRAAHFLEAREPPLILAAQVVELFTVGNLDVLLCETGQVVSQPEKEHVDLHFQVGSLKIETRPRSPRSLILKTAELISIHDPTRR